jgi:rare lipoprotein A (peptidoglycan hydrolase)
MMDRRPRGKNSRALIVATPLLAGVLFSAACAGKPAPASAPTAPRVQIGGKETGLASWYGPDFHGNRTANGERYNMFALTAAHRTLPFGTLVKVRNLENHREVTVRINDRGPFVDRRIIDLSYGAARAIGLSRGGTAKVRIEIVALPGAMTSEDSGFQDVVEDAVGVVALAEQGPVRIVDLHVRKGRDAELLHDG